MRKRSVCFAVLAAFLLCCGCGAKKTEFVCGLYYGTRIEQGGTEELFSNRFSDGNNTILLEKDGTGVFTLNGDMCTLNWTYSGSRLTIKTQNESSVGTLENGVLRLNFLGDASVMTFVREDLLSEELPNDDSDLSVPVSELGNETAYEWSGKINGIHVTILSMEYTTGLNGEDCVRAFFELESERIETVIAGQCLEFHAYQNGKPLCEAFGEENEATDLLIWESLHFGKPMTVSCVFALNDHRSTVALEVTDAERKTVVAGCFDP